MCLGNTIAMLPKIFAVGLCHRHSKLLVIMLGGRILLLQPHCEVQEGGAGSKRRTDTEIAPLTLHLLRARGATYVF